jgi:KipI family sensor histidine kinase inhibitor
VTSPPANEGLQRALAALEQHQDDAMIPGRTHRIDVVYDGPDLEHVANACGLPVQEIISIHSSREYLVELLGFMPGFAYMGPLDPRLVVPRRPLPRPSVPAGSVAIAGSFTGVYPFTSPGGWNLLGRALDFVPFDLHREPPISLSPGDRVRFVPVQAANEVPPLVVSKEPPVFPGTGKGMEILRAPVGATIQDLGRAGNLSRGLPPSGPLDWVTHALANRAVGNRPDAATIEIPLGSLEIRAAGDLVLSIDGQPPVALKSHDTLAIPAGPRAVRYLAVAGGFDVPIAIGSRSTLLVAKLGGFEGRPIRPGDCLPIGGVPTDWAAPASSSVETLDIDASADLEVDPGPHSSRFPAGAFETLLATEFRVSKLGDRVGVRLEGGKIPRDRPDLAVPAPMIRGAIQVSTDGTPIVLGPDHPTTGGYPVLAVLRRRSQWALARRRPGEVVLFRRAS